MRTNTKEVIELIVLVAATVALLFAYYALAGAIVQCVWNGIMPFIFGIKKLTLVQAVGVFILGNMLFGKSSNPINIK